MTEPRRETPEAESGDETQLFTVAFNPKTKELAFIGSMPLEQAFSLVQQAMLDSRRAQGKAEGLAEAADAKTTPPPSE